MNSAIPTTIFTGFLGAGKTDVLRRLARKGEQLGLQLGFLVNEANRFGIDGRLIRGATQSGDLPMVELNGGCVCCDMSAGLEPSLAQLAKISKQRPLKHLLIELSGKANPTTVVQTLFLQTQFRLAKVITVVDRINWRAMRAERLRDEEQHDIFDEQIALADIVLASKGDLAGDDHPTSGLAPLTDFVFGQNAGVTIQPIRTDEELPLELLLRDGVPTSQKIRHTGRGRHQHGAHCAHGHDGPCQHHHDLIPSAAPTFADIYIEVEGELDPGLFAQWWSGVLRTLGTDLARMKGGLRLRGGAVVAQSCYQLSSVRPAQSWELPERGSDMAIHGKRELLEPHAAALESGLRACAVAQQS